MLTRALKTVANNSFYESFDTTFMVNKKKLSKYLLFSLIKTF